MQDKTAFDVWCLINPDFRQIAKRVIFGSRPELTRPEITKEINTHINASKPMLIATGKRLRYWKSLVNQKPPWAHELHLYQSGFAPESEDTAFCEIHSLHYDKGITCPICSGIHI